MSYFDLGLQGQDPYRLQQPEQAALANNPYNRPQPPVQFNSGGLNNPPPPNLGGGQDNMGQQANALSNQQNMAGLQQALSAMSGGKQGGGLLQGIGSLLGAVAMMG